MISVMIVDDDPFVSGSLKIILDNEPDIEVKAVANSGEEAVKLAPSVNPDVIVMDIRMEGMSGTDAAQKIIEGGSGAAVLFLTTFLDDEFINKALKIGAKGYIIKQDCGSLPSSVRAVASGQVVFGGKVVEKLPDLLNRKVNFDPSEFDITQKELEVIKFVADGLSNKEISEKMFLGEGTVRNLVSSILTKLDLRDRTQLACFYYQKMV